MLKSAFFGKNTTFTQCNSMRTVLKIFLVLFSIKGCSWKLKNNGLCIWNPASGLFQIGHKLKKKNNKVIISLHDVFLLSSLASSTSFMSMSSLVLELWQSLFIRDLTINPKIPPPEFSPISGYWSEWAISNLVWMSLMKS